MKGFHFKLFILYLFILISFLLTRAYSFADLLPQERPGEVGLKEIEPFVYFSLKQKGSSDMIETIINQLIETARSQNVFPAGPLLTIFHGNLANIKPEEMEWEVGFPVTPQALVQAPLERKVWQLSPVAACIHVGSYEKIGETIKKMLDWMETNGYEQAGPLLERSTDSDPTKVRTQQLRIEIWIPCKKKV